ncbi:MAG: SDR family oxidoreductase [Candidatus Hydrogenedentes bacterium]|nr:SDR family oxidoreductase [Candidatus Hydrogenedentota bacterium]
MNEYGEQEARRPCASDTNTMIGDPRVQAAAWGKGGVVIGATSAIARATAIDLARQGYAVLLAARDMDDNERIATDLRVRCGSPAVALPFEALDVESHPAFVQTCRDVLGGALEGVVVCFGTLEAQDESQRDFSRARYVLDVNFTAAVSILEAFALHFEQRRSGFIAASSSVAGDRGRQSNYHYGAAKAGLSAYLQGLRNRLFQAGVSVTTIKPGFVDTKMTFGLPGLMMVASAEGAGKAVAAAIRKRKNVAYVPWFWRYIMLIIIHIPELIFKRLRL